MRRLLFLLAIFLLPSVSHSQAIPRVPDQLPEVSDEEYRYAVKILEETVAGIKKNQGEYNYIDYWNLAVAYAICRQSGDKIADFLQSSRQLDPHSFALLLSYDVAKPRIENWRELLGDERFKYITTSEVEIPSDVLQEEEDRTARVAAYSDFQCEVEDIHQADRRYRTGDYADIDKQSVLDQQNLARIDSLYARYGTYIGKDLVGKDLANVMWLVIQHSNLATMKRYFPVLQQAVREQQLSENPLRMLIDRICWLEEGVQLYGSQIGIPIATDEQQERLKTAYPLPD